MTHQRDPEERPTILRNRGGGDWGMIPVALAVAAFVLIAFLFVGDRSNPPSVVDNTTEQGTPKMPQR